MKLSDINRCGLQGFPPNTKKKYSGLIGNWIWIEYYIDDQYESKTWEFGWKQKALKSEPLWKYYYKGIKEKDLYKLKSTVNTNKNYLIDDYSSCFIVFRLYLLKKNKETISCSISLDSTYDGEFRIQFNEKYILDVKKFFIKNYKTLTLDKILEYMTSNCEGYEY